MKIRLLTVSHKQPAWVGEATAEYQQRLPREWGFAVVEVKPEARTSGVTSPRVQAAEAERLRKALGAARPIALDERGQPWSTAQWAERLGRWLQEGRDVGIVVGGADGLDQEFARAAEQRVSLSPLTLPHGLVRVVVVEQLYRAATLLQGHPYHRGTR
jgi:23S rRNA (pseudouridine1915-N3)-methyltransferase